MVTKSDKTRQALLEAGLDLFAEKGLDGASIRMVAKKAGVNSALIQYYFGGKEGLYKAIIETSVETIWEPFRPIEADAHDRMAKGEVSKEEARQLILDVSSLILDAFLKNPLPRSWMLLVLREEMKSSDIFDMVFQNQIKSLYDAFTGLFAIVTETDPNQVKTKIRVHALLGQIMIFILKQQTFLKHINQPELTDDVLQDIKQIIADNWCRAFETSSAGA